MRALVVRRLGVRALVAGLAAAGVVWSGGCVSTTGCPPSVAIDSLDPSIRSALTLDDAWGRAVGAEPDYAGTQRYDFERGRPVRTSLRWAGEAGPVVLPMVRRSNVWGVRVLAVGLDGVERPVTVRIDTGHAGQLAIDGDTARDIGAPTLAGVSPGMHYTAFGPKASQLGVLAGLRLGDATLAPVGPEIECDGPAFEPLLGVDLLDRFGHAVFDWAGRRLILLPRGADVAGAAGDTRWVALPWRAGARVRTDAGVRTVVNDDRRATLVDIDGVQYHALIDTAFSGGLFVLEPIPGVEKTGRIKARGHGRRGSIDTGRLTVAGKAGPIDLSGVEVFIADTSSLGFVQRAGFDVMLGLDALTQYPMWLDFEAGEVRFWTGQGEPSVPGVKPRAEQGVE